ncbi:GNAT family N-acetyltransferase [Gallaecimonas sp. GXIMD4217]|uniref:GNAT family N-acetyltransferase n=1 Tax=Gallaecimonas sp. GXIMD4217 TaxID=3131927 RepID=UPI00311B2AC8
MIHYRQATAADIPQMSAIRLAVTENVLSDPAKVTTLMYEDYLERLGRGWVAEEGGQVLGFSYAASADNSIWALFVLPGQEGRGMGRRLLELATNWLFERGAEAVVLSTDADTRADRFYQAQGWQRGQVHPDGEVGYRLPRRRYLGRALTT